MPGTRPASYTTFAVLNFVYGGLLLLCAVCTGVDPSMEVNHQDITAQLKAYLNQEVPGYSAIKIGGAVACFALAAGLIAAGVGLLQVSMWGRVLGILCAGFGLLHHAGLSFWQLFVVNPALDRSPFFPRIGPFSFSALPKFVYLLLVIGWIIGAVFFLIELLVLAITPAQFVPQLRAQPDEEWEEQPRRRPARPPRWEDEADDDRRPRRPR
jgi:hypothetical protein